MFHHTLLLFTLKHCFRLGSTWKVGKKSCLFHAKSKLHRSCKVDTKTIQGTSESWKVWSFARNECILPLIDQKTLTPFEVCDLAWKSWLNQAQTKTSDGMMLQTCYSLTFFLCKRLDKRVYRIGFMHLRRARITKVPSHSTKNIDRDQCWGYKRLLLYEISYFQSIHSRLWLK